MMMMILFEHACTLHKHKRQDKEPMSRQGFEFVRYMGKGTYGAVWKVIDQSTKCSYALKVIDKVRVIANKCVKAANTEKLILAHLAQTESHYIVKLHAAFQDQRHLYLLMEFIEGDSLRNYLIRGLSFIEEDIKCRFSCILGALQCLRANSIIHRDQNHRTSQSTGRGNLCSWTSASHPFFFLIKTLN